MCEAEFEKNVSLIFMNQSESANNLRIRSIQIQKAVFKD